MAHYNRSHFVKALRNAGVGRGDILFGHSHIGFFGFPEEGRDQETVFKVILDAIFEVIGDEGTIVAPAFTYSFPKDELFDPVESVGIGGMFAEMLRKIPESRRSHDPSVSVVALGAVADQITVNMPENSYSSEGIFGRLLSMEAKAFNMNIDAATTFVHYAEREMEVPYRFDKVFSGYIRLNGQEREIQNSIWVRYLVDETFPVFEPFDRIAVEKGYCQMERIGRGFIKVMTLKNQFKLVEETLPHEPWFLTKAGLTGKIPDLSQFTEDVM